MMTTDEDVFFLLSCSPAITFFFLCFLPLAKEEKNISLAAKTNKKKKFSVQTAKQSFEKRKENGK